MARDYFIFVDTISFHGLERAAGVGSHSSQIPHKFDGEPSPERKFLTGRSRVVQGQPTHDSIRPSKLPAKFGEGIQLATSLTSDSRNLN